MRVIAFSLLTLFGTFTVVLSTYFLWQNNKIMIMLPIEEEDAGHSISLEVPFVHEQESILFDFVYIVITDDLITHNIEPYYEDVVRNTPYSPPDVLMLA